MEVKFTPQQAHNSTVEQLIGLGFDLNRTINHEVVDGFYIYTQEDASSEAQGEDVCNEEQEQEQTELTETMPEVAPEPETLTPQAEP